MGTSIIDFLSALSGSVFRFAAICFVLVNGAALAAFTLTRSRRFVDAWTRRVLTIDAILLGAGLGVPLLAGAAKLGVRMLAGMAGGVLSLFK